MKKTAIFLLLLVINASAEKTLWKDEINCVPMIPGGDYTEIMFLKSCSNPDKAFNQWLRDNKPNWAMENFTRINTESWIVFHRHN